LSSIIPDQPNELILTESRTMRAQTIGRTDVLDKVKALSLLPDSIHATTEIVASYYEVDPKTIDSLVSRNRGELEENGLRKLEGQELREFKQSTDPHGEGLSSRSKSLRLFTRRTILNVGQLLTESGVAKAVRTYLLDVEEQATPEQREVAIESRRINRALGLVQIVAAMDDSVDAKWKRSKQLHHYAVAAGEAPEIPLEDRALTVETYLTDQGLSKDQRRSVRSTFGRKVSLAYEIEHDEKPKDSIGLVDGRERNVKSYTEADRPLFDKVWGEYYAAQFPAAPVQDRLDGAA
jgi:hypothetical protein